MATVEFQNPFRPGAGHSPPYLAGREEQREEFVRLLKQDVILDNMVLTGLRGVGKTVLLETFNPLAVTKDWLWVGSDLSESSSVDEKSLVTRILTDLSVATSAIQIDVAARTHIGFSSEEPNKTMSLSYAVLKNIYDCTPGLNSDKLKAVLSFIWPYVKKHKKKGVIFAYDEAQTFSDHPKKDEYPLSMLLDVFQSIQRQKIPFMLVLTGLPTLFTKLVEARTFAERMFRVVELDRLTPEASRDAILKPIEKNHCPIGFDEQSVSQIMDTSAGYPYFIQFICREVFDVFIQKLETGERASVPVDEITRKLDSDFFAGRWNRASDRQRELLRVIAELKTAHGEFTVQEIVEQSQVSLRKPFGSSHVNQMLSTLCNRGLVYKNRYGKYSLAVPLLDQFILRQLEQLG